MQRRQSRRTHCSKVTQKVQRGEGGGRWQDIKMKGRVYVSMAAGVVTN